MLVMGRKAKITKDLLGEALQFIESDKNGVEITDWDPKNHQYITRPFKKRDGGQTYYGEFERFLRTRLEQTHEVPRRTVHKVFEILRNSGYIENIKPHKGIWAVTQYGREIIRGRKILGDVKKYMDQKILPGQLIGFGWTLEHKLESVYIIQRIAEPEIMSWLYNMRKSFNDDREFSEYVGRIVYLSLATVYKVSRQPEFSKLIEGLSKDKETTQIVSKLISSFQKLTQN